MKFIIVFAVLFVVACALPPPPPPAPVDKLKKLQSLPPLHHEEVRDEHGQYALRYVTADNTIVTETGQLELNADRTKYVLVIKGEYEYMDPTGEVVKTSYESGPDGFKVSGTHVPV